MQIDVEAHGNGVWTQVIEVETPMMNLAFGLRTAGCPTKSLNSHYLRNVLLTFLTETIQLSASANNSHGVDFHGQYYSGRIVFQFGNLRLRLWKTV